MYVEKITYLYNKKAMRNIIDKDLVKKLYDEGKSYEEISKILGFSTSSIGRCYRKNFGILKDRSRNVRQNIQLTQAQKEILFGGLLGDFCLVKHVKNYRGSVAHSIKQENYAKFLHSKLNSIVGKFRYTKVKANNKIYDECQFTLRPNLQLESFYNSFYNDFNGKKDVPYDLSLLTPLAIAIWFMDDGFLINNGHSQTLGFSTCSFSLEGLIRLQNYLKTKYDIDTIIRRNFYLVVRQKDAQKLASLIRPYIIKEMYYKLGIYK